MYGAGFPHNVVDSLNAGLSASIATREEKLHTLVKVSLIQPSSYEESVEQLLTTNVEKAGDELLVIVGPLGNQNVLWVRDKLEEHDLVAFAPLSYSDEVRGWNPHFYYPSVEPKAELLALIRYAVVFLRLRRVGFMYLKGTNFGDSSYTFTEQVMSMMGYKLCGTFAIDGNVNERIGDDVFDKEWEKFVKTRPQAVLLFGSPHDITKKFIHYLLREDHHTADAFVLTTSSSQTFLLNTWKEALEETNTELKPGQLIITGTGPLAGDTRYKIIQRFREEMTKYLNTNENWGGFAKPEHFDTNHNSGELMVLGWLAGEMLMRALVDTISLTNRTLFRLSLYNQRRYLIDDMVIGDFGGECGSAAQLQGAVCRCNQGGSVVYMKEVVGKYHLEAVEEGLLTWGTTRCFSTGIRVYAPLSGLVILISDNHVVQRANSLYFSGAVTLTGNDHIGDNDRLFFHSLNSSYSGAAKDLNDTLDERIVSAVFGVVTNEVLTTPGVIFFDPMVVFPQVSTFKRNVIHFFPTLTQELYVLAQYFSRLTNHIAHTIIRSDEAAEVAEVLSMSLMTFGASLGSRVLLNEHVSDIHMEHLKHGGDVFILGLTTPDVKTISKYLDTHPQARVFITFTDLLLYYEELKLEFSVTANAKAQRLLFATSLPHWADNSSTSETIIAYHEAVPDPSQWSPMSLRGFAIARVMQTLLLPMKKVSSSLLSDEIFWQTSFVIDDMRYGPFSDSDCIANGVQLSGNCVWNYGATDISVWSFGRVLDPTFPVMQEPVTPSIVYKKIRVQLSSSQVAGIIIGLVFALLLFVTLGVALYCTISNKRDNELAPRQSTDPVTLIFTDIESSTAQWATYPDIMTEAVAAHHRMIRQLVLKHDCYEVKTIGDSFMIACQDPFKAVQLAADLQLMFLHNDWGTDALDNFYREFEEANAKEDNEYTSPTACLDSEVYCRLWSGLRVRIGIHTGLCDIRHDEVTKGYDYYGPTTNMAARTESVANGGQVLLTHATYMSLSESQRHQVDVTALGPVQLRGVPQPVQLYQLNAVPGRTFVALRLDHDYYFEDGNETTNSTSENSSSRVELSESAQMIMSSLQMLLATFKGQQREKLLMPYCERWRVPLPRTNTEEWNDEYCREVIHRIAAKVGRVADHYAGTHSNHSISTLSSTSVVIISDNKILLDE
ncbi:expression site-associated gene 4 (ESAG4) protein, putative [Trypanosoma brucei brucei TREU927]|uniref:adenylate cyclase n=1 Tax=Trypanosoma brucei brucei (strain 927/4 GUTat10.1) TaxID=185431 RepID=Q387N6_TRYB2|nr:expression site-associated gene 4 (ESAG4) protein, putative [Trypanosoma brucei brucei TREU927]EAN78995.1 expression site-associated gene 4 (ESAG4) protein, putative [Trypanosoma brucei brucei TREU927]